ncbi:MAG: thymidine kinase [Candidatus Neomarinimicrobiota bacterium]|tara:strand:- start:139 stop:693 length:555 start_codon:yes stop_codon:yes gene_type:complete
MKQSFTDAGKIEVICGCMFSGKTEELIRRIRRAQIAKLSVIVFKPFIDSRYSRNEIVSHNNIKIESHSLKSSMEIKSYSLNFDVIGIDEAQFFDKNILKVCQHLAFNGKRVLIAGLDKDYRGLPFGSMPQLMCEADYLDKLRAICVKCSRSASYTKRISTEVGQVVIGELDKYEARCRKCFVDA